MSDRSCSPQTDSLRIRKFVLSKEIFFNVLLFTLIFSRVVNLAGLKDRAVSLKLDPLNHPLKKAYYPYVCVGAFLLRFIDMRWRKITLCFFCGFFGYAVPKILLSRSQKSSFTLKKEVG